jgi:hypothetical protein
LIGLSGSSFSLVLVRLVLLPPSRLKHNVLYIYNPVLLIIQKIK